MVHVFCTPLHFCEVHEDISNVFQLTELTQVQMVEMAIPNDPRAVTPKVGNSYVVMVHAFCTPSHDALHLCEVS